MTPLTTHPASRTTPHVVIIGGGITGLSTAWYLHKAAPDLRVTIFEAGDRLGGKVETHFVDGDAGRPFVLEAGADAFLAKQKPWAYQLALDLGLADRLLPTNDANSGVFVVNNGKLLSLPAGLQLIIPTRWDTFAASPLISEAGKTRIAQERQIPARSDDADESVAEFVNRRFGDEALEKLGEPLLSGIYSAQPEEQSILATFPRFRQMERQHGSLLGAVNAAQNASRASAPISSDPQPTSAFVSFHNGTQELVHALAAQVQATVRLQTRIEQLERTATGYRLRWDSGEIEADAVVLTVPAAIAAPLLSPISPPVACEIGALRTVSSGVAYLAYRRADVAHPMQGFGVVIPRAEGRDFNVLTWVTSKFCHRAPDDYVLIRLFFGGARTPHMMERDDNQIIGNAKEELAALMNISAPPSMTRIFRWWHAQPQYDVGHLGRMERIQTALPPHLYVGGTAYGGVGIPDCVHQGEQIAAQILQKGQFLEKNIKFGD